LYNLVIISFIEYSVYAEMEDPVDMQDDVRRNQGWKVQLVSCFKSWVIFIVACYFFVLRLLQEFFKTGEDLMTAEKKPMSVDEAPKPNLRSAGEIQVEHTKEDSDLEHTVVDLHSPSTPAAAPAPLEQKPLEPSSDQSKNTLVIKNLPFKFKLSDLEKLLSEYPAKVKNVRLLRDESGKFTGMAFIRCGTKEDAQILISQMNNLDISGRPIQVEFKTKNKKKKNKLTQSSDSMSSSSSEWEERPARLLEELKPLRRKSTSDSVHPHQSPHPSTLNQSANILHQSANTSYAHSAVSRIHAEKSGIRPVRQPIGPDGKTNGFSADYRRSRVIKH